VELLRRDKLIPDDLIDFLDYTDSLFLLRRAGGGYLFVHRLLSRTTSPGRNPRAPAGKSRRSTTEVAG
jgi:hypothetical protein